MEVQNKMVTFEKYCKKCSHYKTPEVEEPCNTCMTQNYNENSECPVSYDGPRPGKEEDKA